VCWRAWAWSCRSLSSEGQAADFPTPHRPLRRTQHRTDLRRLRHDCPVQSLRLLYRRRTRHEDRRHLGPGQLVRGSASARDHKCLRSGRPRTVPPMAITEHEYRCDHHRGVRESHFRFQPPGLHPVCRPSTSIAKPFSLHIVAGDPSVPVGNTLQPLAIATYPDTGRTADLSSQVSWSSSDSKVATVDARGVIAAVAPGDAVITARLRLRTVKSCRPRKPFTSWPTASRHFDRNEHATECGLRGAC